MRRVPAAVLLLALTGATCAACSSGAAPADTAAAASPSPSASPSDATSTPQVTTAPVSASQCSGSDYGLASGYTAWSTLMRDGKEFSAWESATAYYLSSARSTAETDATFSGADAQDALDAQALAAALAQVDADLQQGLTSGEAPASYAGDVKAAQGAAAMFAGCAR